MTRIKPAKSAAANPESSPALDSPALVQGDISPESEAAVVDTAFAESAIATAKDIEPEPEPALTTSTSANPEAATATPTEPLPLVTDPFDYSKTVVTVTYTFLPEDGHPEGRLVMVGLRTLGQEPLFSAPLREQSDALATGVAELQARYRLYLPERKVQLEQEAVERAARPPAASVKDRVPSNHAQAIQSNSSTEAVVVSEQRLSLFGK